MIFRNHHNIKKHFWLLSMLKTAQYFSTESVNFFSSIWTSHSAVWVIMVCQSWAALLIHRCAADNITWNMNICRDASIIQILSVNINWSKSVHDGKHFRRPLINCCFIIILLFTFCIAHNERVYINALVVFLLSFYFTWHLIYSNWITQSDQHYQSSRLFSFRSCGELRN